MTNWEKMLHGKMYNDVADSLFDLRVKAKTLFRRYNQTGDDQTELRRQLLEQLFKKVGEDVWIEPDFRCEYGKNIAIGDHTYINFDCIILDCADISIGDHVLFGPRVGLYAANHALDLTERMNGGCVGKPIAIGDNAWLGGDVKVLGGVTIGKGSVIGCGSIVTKDIPEGVVAAGNPCRVLRKITEADRTGYLPVND
jgi:maltose O-acetyltransferase